MVLGLNDDEAVGLVVGESGGGLRGDDGAEGTVGGAVAGLEAVAVGGGGDEAGVGVGGIGCSPSVPSVWVGGGVDGGLDIGVFGGSKKAFLVSQDSSKINARRVADHGGRQP